MKLRIIGILAILMISMSAFAQKADESFKVYGNCEHCKMRIEKTVRGMEGVSNAVWNQKTKILRVKFDSTRTDLKKIHQAVANVGHDTELYTAKDEVYNQLPGCCKYERKKVE